MPTGQGSYSKGQQPLGKDREQEGVLLQWECGKKTPGGSLYSSCSNL